MANSHNKISIIIDRDLKESGDRKFALRRNQLVGKEVVSYGVRMNEIKPLIL